MDMKKQTEKDFSKKVLHNFMTDEYELLDEEDYDMKR